MGFLSLFGRLMTEGKSVGRVKNCTKWAVLCGFYDFFQCILLIFCLLSRSFKHAKFSKVNAAEKFGVDF